MHTQKMRLNNLDSKNIETLEKAITKTTKVLIWLTDYPLNLETDHLDEIDIFSNRLITKNIIGQPLEDGHRTSLFVSKNFNNSFFIFHHVFHPEGSMEIIQENLDSIRDSLQDNDEILILNKSNNSERINIVKELKIRYNNFTYTNLYL